MPVRHFSLVERSIECVHLFPAKISSPLTTSSPQNYIGPHSVLKQIVGHGSVVIEQTLFILLWFLPILVFWWDEELNEFCFVFQYEPRIYIGFPFHRWIRVDDKKLNNWSSFQLKTGYWTNNIIRCNKQFISGAHWHNKNVQRTNSRKATPVTMFLL